MSGTQILRSHDLRAENRHRVLRALRDEESLSRAALGKVTGLSQAALSTLLGTMSEQGIVTSLSRAGSTNKPGRPQTRVALAPGAAYCVTVVLRVDSLIVCVIDYAGQTISKTDTAVSFTSLDTRQLTKLVIDSIKDAIAGLPAHQFKAICIGFQGVTDSQTGELLWSPILSVGRVPIADRLRKIFSVPVAVNNDCALIASALHRTEKTTLGDSFVAILFSHGIGMGAYLSGKPFYGAHSSALELGHIQFIQDGARCRCGKYGCIEAYAADYGIARTAAGVSQSSIPVRVTDGEMFESLIHAALNGDKQAVQAFKLAGRAIGSGLATVFNLFDPMPVALIGHNSDTVRLMSPDIQQALGAVSRGQNDYANLIHCFPDDIPQLLDGAAMNALTLADREFANIADQKVEEEAS